MSNQVPRICLCNKRASGQRLMFYLVFVTFYLVVVGRSIVSCRFCSYILKKYLGYNFRVCFVKNHTMIREAVHFSHSFSFF